MGRNLAAAALLGAAALAPAATAAPPTVIRTGGPSAPHDPKVAIVASDAKLDGRAFQVITRGQEPLEQWTIALQQPACAFRRERQVIEGHYGE